MTGAVAVTRRHRRRDLRNDEFKHRACGPLPRRANESYAVFMVLQRRLDYNQIHSAGCPGKPLATTPRP